MIGGNSKLRVAVILSSALENGGTFTQSLNIARLAEPAPDDPYEVDYVALDRSDAAELAQHGITVRHAGGRVARLQSKLVKFPGLRNFLRAAYGLLPSGEGAIDALARRHRYDLVIFTSPSRLVLGIRRTPYIYTIWDVCHRDHPEFPEFTSDGSFRWREDLFRFGLVGAAAYVVDTPQLADRLTRLYGLDADKAIVIPFRPSEQLLSQPQRGPEDIARLRENYGISRPFLFYPAQFWPHKNHVYVVRAIKALRDRDGTRIDAVFSGSDQGHLARVLDLADRLQVRDQIKYLGFLPLADIALLYREAVALVMPTYFGPTNIPPLEAKALGCHVIYSDLPGFREFCGESALYCDLTDPESLTSCIRQVQILPRPAPAPGGQEGHDATRLKAFLRKAAAKSAAWK